ncbi:MAG: DUF2997 domain-containing protein [Thermoguttaceae bacterium]
MKQIILIVAPDGTPKIETRGVLGRACLAASKWLEKALGVVAGDKPTKEQFTAEHQQARQ